MSFKLDKNSAFSIGSTAVKPYLSGTVVKCTAAIVLWWIKHAGGIHLIKNKR